MCLACTLNHQKPSINVIGGKEKIEEIFNSNKEVAKLLNTTEDKLKSLSKYNKTILHLANNDNISLYQEEIDEIINNALCIIVTGVNMQIDIWAIQWKNDYKPKTF